MTALLPPAPASARTTSAAALAAALLAVSDAWLPRVQFREESRWTGLLPSDEAADLIEPSPSDDLAGAQLGC
ncbi:hypothetical protein [Geodermatophilus normandii]|uniref:Uncharacterized protein n=1 Tax=Geodermatophilus normandii TaxID=1137989 RepID=A0A6P0G8X1_9ACTN|nr:hypothetical protein [Geodermatophilus normandii]NEM04586.1 hypothetical protein [Geodermatophilus normandii]